MRENSIRILAICALIPTQLYADDNTASGNNIEMKASEIGSYDSNPLLISNGAKGLWGSKTTPELIINSNNGNSKFDLDTSVVENIYDQSDFDSTDFHGKANLEGSNDRWSAGLQGKADYDTTRTSELTTFNLNLPRVRRLGLDAAPEFSYHVSPLDTFSVTSSAGRYTYDNSAFVDYDFYTINPSYSRHFSPTDSAILTLQTQRYQTEEGPNNTTDSYGPTIGWQRIMTPRFSTTLTAGFEKTSQDSAIATSRSTNLNYTFKGDLAYKDELNSANAIASRAHQPFGNGTEALVDSFALKGTHAINEKLSLNAAAKYDAAEYDSVVGINLDHQFNTNLGLSYRVLPNFDATANYQYTSEVLTNVSGNIKDNAVLLGITYHPPADAF